MKLKADFVTNSSTTSYIVICDGDFSEKDLSRLMGVKKGSPLQGLVKALYKSLHHNLEPIRSAWKINKKYGGDFEAYLKEEFSEKVAHKVKESENQGKQIYVGSLASDETMTESLFCCDSFEWENDELYVNGLNCVW
jgi:hypothetical protein